MHDKKQRKRIHEINNAMTSAQGHAQLLEMKIPGDSTLRPYVDGLRKSLERIRELMLEEIGPATERE